MASASNGSNDDHKQFLSKWYRVCVEIIVLKVGYRYPVDVYQYYEELKAYFCWNVEAEDDMVFPKKLYVACSKKH